MVSFPPHTPSEYALLADALSLGGVDADGFDAEEG
jgi:hypothetical protein